MGVLETSLFVNEDWSALVPAGSLEARFGITPKDAKRLGLLPLEAGETLGEPEVLTSANLAPAPEAAPEAVAEPEPEPDIEPTTEDEPVADPIPEPEVKEAAPVADKAVQKPANKGTARKDRNGNRD